MSTCFWTTSGVGISTNNHDLLDFKLIDPDTDEPISLYEVPQTDTAIEILATTTPSANRLNWAVDEYGENYLLFPDINPIIYPGYNRPDITDLLITEEDAINIITLLISEHCKNYNYETIRANVAECFEEVSAYGIS